MKTTTQVSLNLADPHHLLGLHPAAGGGRVVRVWRPGALSYSITLFGERREMVCIDPAGLFELAVPAETGPQDYTVDYPSGLVAHDPYAFTPTLGEVDHHLIGRGVHYQLHRALGGNLRTHEGVEGASFAVWAPNARGVALVCDSNHFDGRTLPMRSLGGCGVWELFVPGLGEGEKYKFEVRTEAGDLLLKADPLARWSELRPKTASRLFDLDRYSWGDGEWMDRRSCQGLDRPVAVYELHLGSWRRGAEGFLTYSELALQLADYCTEMGFTHVELLPIMEHPLDESWGYQVTGFFAATSRFGSPRDFQCFVDTLHQRGIGVIVDWVPAHFPSDAFSLAKFDGTALYEHDDPRQGWHPHWGTHIFNYGRAEVSNFLIASALYWMEEMHIDGLRVDAVASMLYLDYGREEGGWIPNRYGGKENLEAIEFLRHLNSVVHQRCPGALMIAEESTSFCGVTHSDRLGFDLKWNMGWMNDTLSYFSKDPFYRHYHHDSLTFGLLYAFSERFALVLSHDEVVHGKRSLIGRMPGDWWQQFANLRLLLSYLYCQPGKKLLFMGGEFGQWDEWNSQDSLQWWLLDLPTHRGVQEMVRDLNQLYLAQPALWERDFDFSGFEWIDFHDRHNSTISYWRKGSSGSLICVHNFTPSTVAHYFVPAAGVRSLSELFNSDSERYGGSGKTNLQVELIPGGDGHNIGFQMVMPPLATAIFEVRS